MDLVGVLGLLVLGALAGAGLGWFLWGRKRRILSEQIVAMYNRLTASDLEKERLLDELAAASRPVEPPRPSPSPSPGASPSHDMNVVLHELETKADLENIKGIGPKLALLLAAEGINNLARLANMSDGALDHLGHRLPAVAERIRREKWREQAREILASTGKGQQVANHSSGSAPEDLTIDLKEPDAAVTPEL
ncbi:MAG TPA: hypothetical protein VJR05_14740 [Acidimicrobiia bacterium]|nr:hypothetical protein [Acidimicrobiia bacterium]